MFLKLIVGGICRMTTEFASMSVIHLTNLMISVVFFLRFLLLLVLILAVSKIKPDISGLPTSSTGPFMDLQSRCEPLEEPT